ncbi:pyridoxal-phosphate-dependent aminotransferase family protein [Calderihabitans maritimus]|uniref:Class V aminotransferase n=1 Tax=Calderihabitans maritimus TaxID=1246530 RepID=A0A1Z5HW53_9FIRM|nr:alanine--glyoxylate aminotransferase family protein [Calderihabitans maritimus]GAW93638.1 class V aminotransferase [Calderihabitans maritimus]
MREDQIFLLPGPTPVPPQSLRSMSSPMINHRGPAFKEILEEVTPQIQKIMETKNDVFILTASGTGGMEAAVANFTSPGDKVLVASIGSFGERFKKICERYGTVVDFIDFPWGTAIDPEVIREKLNKDKKREIKAIFLQHNETSTGVINDLKAVSEARGEHPALLIVDAVSGLAAGELKTDAWNLDVVISGSQKAFMIPPGLAMISVSQRAWEVAQKSTNPVFYFDLKQYKEFLSKGQTPWTPAISLFYALKESLQLMLEEGLDNILKRHRLHRDMVRAGVKAIGLELLASDEVASPAVTAVIAPEGIQVNAIRSLMQNKYNVALAGGQGKLKNKIFRIGHLGYVKPTDIFAALASLELVLTELGLKVDLGVGVRAAQRVLLERSGENAHTSQ